MNCIVILAPEHFEAMSLDALVRLCRFENKDARRELAKRALAGNEAARAHALYLRTMARLRGTDLP